MKAKCPGQASNRTAIEAVNLACPKCGRQVEMFSDESRRRCQCRNMVTRTVLPKCAAWCSAAAECFGEATDVRILKAKVAQVKDDPRAKQCLKTIQDLLKKRNRKGESSR
jgi:hypothetical protein